MPPSEKEDGTHPYQIAPMIIKPTSADTYRHWQHIFLARLMLFLILSGHFQ